MRFNTRRSVGARASLAGCTWEEEREGIVRSDEVAQRLHMLPGFDRLEIAGVNNVDWSPRGCGGSPAIHSPCTHHRERERGREGEREEEEREERERERGREREREERERGREGKRKKDEYIF